MSLVPSRTGDGGILLEARGLHARRLEQGQKLASGREPAGGGRRRLGRRAGTGLDADGASRRRRAAGSEEGQGGEESHGSAHLSRPS